MWILDRQRYWNFFKAYVICFTTLIGLYIVIDVFANIDEFAKRAKGLDLLKLMGRFYLVHSTMIYDRLFGVITMMAAIFTVTWMQRSNELIAMLAAGIGTRRVIRPVLISAVLVNCVAIANQEWLMPQFGEELLKEANEDESKSLPVSSRYDTRDILIHGRDGDVRSKTVWRFTAHLSAPILGAQGEFEAKQAVYIPPDHPSAPLKGGWLLWGASIGLPKDADVSDFLIKLEPARLAGFALPLGSPQEIDAMVRQGVYFFRTNVSFDAVTRSRSQWYRFAPTLELIKALRDPTNKPELTDIAVFLHGRIVRPLLSMTLLFLSLPIVLGGEGKNMFINMGLSLATSAGFQSAIFLAQYFAGFSLIGPELSAWIPLIVFGSIAAARWDTIRT